MDLRPYALPPAKPKPDSFATLQLARSSLATASQRCGRVHPTIRRAKPVGHLGRSRGERCNPSRLASPPLQSRAETAVRKGRDQSRGQQRLKAQGRCRKPCNGRANSSFCCVFKRMLTRDVHASIMRKSRKALRTSKPVKKSDTVDGNNAGTNPEKPFPAMAYACKPSRQPRRNAKGTLELTP